MKHLINREDYINEYIRVKINNEENQNELYEGLLSTVFGGLKMLLKKDWANIKCKNPSVLEYLKEIDKNLSGYTMTKMRFFSECQNIRQNIADYFNDILDYKLAQIEKEDDANKFIEKENKEKEENKESKGVEKKLNLKDKTLLDSIKKYKDNISTKCKVDPKLREYADQFLNSVELFVNNIVLNELEKKGADKKKLEEKRKKLEEERKKLEEERKKKDEESKKAEEETIKKIADERDKSMRNLGVKPIGPMSGDKSIETIAKQFSDMLGEFNNIKLNESALPKGYSEILRSDVYIGIQKSLEELNWNFSENEQNSPDGLYDKFFIRVILNKINSAFEVISNNKDKFKDTPSASVQAMMISLSNAVIYGFMGKEFNIESNNERLSLMTKCAIDSDATIGFNLPLIEPEKPDNGNFFVSIMNQFRSANITSEELDDAANSLSDEEIKQISKVWNKNGSESNESEENNNDSNEPNNKEKEEVAADPKNKDEFIKEFSSKVMKDFRQNMSNLFDIIVKKAKKIKDNAQKKREVEAAKAQQESELEEK